MFCVFFVKINVLSIWIEFEYLNVNMCLYSWRQTLFKVSIYRFSLRSVCISCTTLSTLFVHIAVEISMLGWNKEI